MEKYTGYLIHEYETYKILNRLVYQPKHRWRLENTLKKYEEAYGKREDEG